MNIQTAALLTSSSLKSLISDVANFNKNFRLLEAHMGEETRQAYDSGHIENAIFFDAMKCVTQTKYYPRNLPDKSGFQDYVSSLGISNNHHLIIYDRSPFGFYTSSRLWMIFRLFGHEKVSILNGGIGNWQKNENSLSTVLPSFEKQTFQVNENKELRRDFEQMKQIIEKQNEQIVDARPSPDFSKLNESTQQANNMPGSKNVPYPALFDQTTGLLKEKDELMNLLKSQNVDLNKPMVASCLTSVSASSLAFALYLLGVKDVPIYFGSWTEYSQKILEQ